MKRSHACVDGCDGRWVDLMVAPSFGVGDDGDGGGDDVYGDVLVMILSMMAGMARSFLGEVGHGLREFWLKSEKMLVIVVRT